MQEAAKLQVGQCGVAQLHNFELVQGRNLSITSNDCPQHNRAAVSASTSAAVADLNLLGRLGFHSAGAGPDAVLLRSSGFHFKGHGLIAWIVQRERHRDVLAQLKLEPELRWIQLQ